MEDLAGQTYNDLTAVRISEYTSKTGRMWIWRCVCGKEVEYSVSRVKRSHTMSCGCRRARECGTKKICKHCGELSLRKNRHGNFASVCQKCYNKQCNSFKERNPKIRMLQSASIRAKKHNVPFELTEDDFEIPDVCPVLGVPLVSGTKKYHDQSPSLDRLDPSKGYVKGNVAVISFRANRIKGDATVAELEIVLTWTKNQLSLAA